MEKKKGGENGPTVHPANAAGWGGGVKTHKGHPKAFFGIKARPPAGMRRIRLVRSRLRSLGRPLDRSLETAGLFLVSAQGTLSPLHYFRVLIEPGCAQFPPASVQALHLSPLPASRHQ